MKRERTGYVDLNDALRLINLVLPFVLLFIWPYQEGVGYIDAYGVAIFLVFSLLNHLLIHWERKRRDPLLLLLITTIVCFYMFRVVTLTYIGSSYVLPRFDVGAEQVNYSLFYLMACVISITIGLKLGAAIDVGKHEARGMLVQKRWLLLTCLVVLLQFLAFLDQNYVGRFTGLLRTIFSLNFMVLLALVGSHYVSGDLARFSRLAVIGVVAAFFILATLAGARSAAMTVILLFVFSRLGVLGFVALRLRTVVTLALLVPMLVLVYGVAHSFRYIRMDVESESDYAKTLKIASEAATIVSQNADADKFNALTISVLGRLGYLDFAVDIIANRDRYAKIINLEYYGMSLVDNLLTPGFDVFDVPRAAQALKSVYLNIPVPSKAEVDADYHSDGVTVFGEYHTLFGPYASQVFLLVSAALFAMLFKRFAGATFNSGVSRAVLLSVFLSWLWSYGLDWILIDTTFLLVTYFVTMQILMGRKVSSGSRAIGPAPVSAGSL